MKTRIMSMLMSLTLIVIISSAKFAASQKRSEDVKTDTVPLQSQDPPAAVKVLPIDVDKKLNSNDSIIEATNAKAGQVDEKFDNITKKGSRLEGKIDMLGTRQYWILRKLTPVTVDILAIHPSQAKPITVNADSLQIKPIEVQKRNWWRRRFK